MSAEHGLYNVSYVKNLEARIVELEGQNKGLVLVNAFLRQRPNLPVDRIPVYERMSKRIAQLEAALTRIKLQDGYPITPEYALQASREEAETAVKENPK